MEADLLNCLPALPSKALAGVLHTIQRIASQDVPVLITGEGGVGKEVVANFIHQASGRAQFIANPWCGTLEPPQLEQECQAAEGCTLFLRDLCEMPIRTQVKLLSIIESRINVPVPSPTAERPCRIIAASSRDPKKAVEEGNLQEALFYRLSAICLFLPPLRERREDIMPLARVFLKRCAAQTNRSIEKFTASAARLLTNYDWPGNLNDLEREVLRAVLLSKGDVVDAGDLSLPPVSLASAGAEDTSFTLLKDIERQAIIQALKDAGGNKAEAAKRLGIGRQTLYNKIRAYNIQV